jgi:hypothetical protein
MKKVYQLSFLMMAFVLLSACSAGVEWARTRGQALNQSSAHFTDKTEVRSHSLTVRESMRSVTLELEATVSQGVVTYRLLDPTGTLLWEQEVTPAEGLNSIERFAPVVGEWTLEVMLLGASGEYELVWRGQ